MESTPKSNNIVIFPKENQRQQNLPINEVQININVNTMKMNHIIETLDVIVPMIFNNMELAGFNIASDDVTENENFKDSALIVEALRSQLCKYYEIKHPFQDLAEDVFQSQEDGSLKLNQKFEVEFDEEFCD